MYKCTCPSWDRMFLHSGSDTRICIPCHVFQQDRDYRTWIYKLFNRLNTWLQCRFHFSTSWFPYSKTRNDVIVICRYLQRSGVPRRTVTFSGNVMATSAVLAATHLLAVVAVIEWQALIVAVFAYPSSGAGAIPVVRIAGRIVLAFAVVFAILSPFATRTS